MDGPAGQVDGQPGLLPTRTLVGVMTPVNGERELKGFAGSGGGGRVVSMRRPPSCD